jgi:hypothetical protein
MEDVTPTALQEEGSLWLKKSPVRANEAHNDRRQQRCSEVMEFLDEE